MGSNGDGGKKWLIRAITDIFGLCPRLALEVVNEVFIHVIDRLAKGQEVNYPGFGQFFVIRERGDKNRRVVKFAAHDTLESIINDKQPRRSFFDFDRELIRAGEIDRDVVPPQDSLVKQLKKWRDREAQAQEQVVQLMDRIRDLENERTEA